MSNHELFFIGATTGFLAIIVFMLANALLEASFQPVAPKPAEPSDPPGFGAMLREVMDVTRGEPDDA